MKKINFNFLILLSLLMTGCTATKINTIWKDGQTQVLSYNKILVAAVLPEHNDSIISGIEQEVIRKFQTLNYTAASNIREFGFNGLNEMGEDNVYMTLCDAGVDVVLTFAFVNSSAAHSLKKGINKKYVNYYFYNHIWNYRNLKNDKSAKHKKLTAELILFDLKTLQSVCVLKSNTTVKNISDPKLIGKFIRKLEQENIIQPQQKIVPLKAF